MSKTHIDEAKFEPFNIQPRIVERFEKNAITDTVMCFKGVAAKGGGNVNWFLDIREQTFIGGRDAGIGSWSKKGVMIHRRLLPGVAAAILRDLADEKHHGIELTPEYCAEVVKLVESKVDPVQRAIDLINNMSAADVAFVKAAIDELE